MFQKIYDRVEDIKRYNALDVDYFLKQLESELCDLNNDFYNKRLSEITKKVSMNIEDI